MECTIISHNNQSIIRTYLYDKIVYRLGMAEYSLTEHLKFLRKKAGYSIREAAEALGLPASTYAAKEDPNKYKKDYLPPDLVAKISELFGPSIITPEDVMALKGDGFLMDTDKLSYHENQLEEPEDLFALEKHSAPELARSQEGIEHFSCLAVSGSVQAGTWNGDNEFTGDDIETVPLPNNIRHLTGLSALKVKGDSMDQVFPPSSIVFVQSIVDFSAEGIPLTTGSYVVVRRCNQHVEWETTIKEVKLNSDGSWLLVPRSSNLLHRPLKYSPDQESEPVLDTAAADQLHIAGVVVSSYNTYIPQS